MKLRQRYQNYVHKHKKLDYFQRCLHRSRDDNFVDFVLSYQRDPSIIRFRSYGLENKDKNIYHIKCGNEIDGFFAIFRKTLNYLAFADRYHLTPVIEYNSNMRYAEKHPINGTINPFEYFFKQPCNIDLVQMHQSYNVVECEDSHAYMAEEGCVIYQGYGYSSEYIASMGEVYEKYIHLNEIVKPILDEQIENILGNKKTLGIHFRGTDFMVGYYNHPVSIKQSSYFDVIQDYLSQNEFEQIFLATDSKETVQLFRERYGDIVVSYSDVIRSNDKVSVIFTEIERENHHYKLALEVMRDTYTLASCSGIICGLSQVSLCARIINKSQLKRYEVEHIIDNGINLTGSYFKG